MSKLLIIGAKGFAKELLECIMQEDPACEVTFFDDVSGDLPELVFDRFPILRSDEEASEYFRKTDPHFALGIGSPTLRARFFDKFLGLGGLPKSIISPFARIGSFANEIGDGSCVLSNAVIESDNKIGRGSLVHVGAFVSHDVTVGEFSEISPRVNLLGNASVGDRCSLGTACTILPTISIGNDARVGAGSVVTKNVPQGMTVVGIPARPLAS